MKSTVSTEYPGSASRGIMIGEMAEQDRPRERLWRLGAESLKDEELLAIIMRVGHGGTSVLELAQRLLHRYQNNLGMLAAASPADLAKIKGIGKAKAAELKATFALATRLAESSLPERARLENPQRAAAYLREIMRDKNQEELHAILLDTKNRFIRDELITKGLVDRSHSHAREVFRAAIQYNAAKMLLAHNHPSGDPTPSAADTMCTKSLVEAGKLIGIEVIDHLIIGAKMDNQDHDYYSFREHDQI